MKKLSIILICIVLFQILDSRFQILPVVHAQGVSLGIYPPVIQITSQPPADITVPITLENYEEQEVTLRIGIRTFTAGNEEDGQIKFLSDNNPISGDPSFFEKIKVSENGQTIEKIVIGGRQQKKVDLSIQIREEDPLSDYYFSVIFISESSPQNGNTGISAGIATNVLLSVGPKGEPKGSIEEFSVPFFVEGGPVPFTLRVKNSGEHYLTPTGAILIKNMFGQTVGNVELLPVNILAGTIRAIPDITQAEESKNIGNSPKAIWPEEFLLGLYSAKLTIALTDKGPVFTKTIHFVAVPIQLLIGIFFAAFLVIVIRNRIKTENLKTSP